MKIANRIKQLATEHGKTIGQLAADMGVVQPQLSRTINNERINLKDLEMLAEKIGCKVGDFFTEETTDQPQQFVCPHCGKSLSVKIE